MDKSGLKYDDGKLRWDLLPWPAIEEIVKVLTYGASKYGSNTWQTVEPFNERYTAALFRHLIADIKGEDVDAESSIMHLSHAACNLVFILSRKLEELQKQSNFEEMIASG